MKLKPLNMRNEDLLAIWGIALIFSTPISLLIPLIPLVMLTDWYLRRSGYSGSLFQVLKNKTWSLTMKCWESGKNRQVLNNPNDNRRSEPSYDCLETEWSPWLTDGFRQEKKGRSWPSQAHHLGLLAMIWMGALSLQLFGVNNFVWPRDLSVLAESTSISGPIESFHLLFIPGSWTHLSSLSPSLQFSWPQPGTYQLPKFALPLFLLVGKSTRTGLFKGSRGWFYGLWLLCAPSIPITFNGWCPCSTPGPWGPVVYFPGEYIVKDLIQHCEQSERDQRLLGSLNKGKTPREKKGKKTKWWESSWEKFLWLHQ